MAPFHFLVMPYRKSAKPLFGTNDPAEEECYALRRARWADSGRLPEDVSSTALENLRKEAQSGQVTKTHIEKARMRIMVAHISDAFLAKIIGILDTAVLRDIEKELTQDIIAAKNSGDLSDEQVSSFRKMITVQTKIGNLTHEEYVSLLELLGLEVRKG